MSAPSSEVLEWSNLADQDLGLAMLAVRHGQFAGLACYHVQQTIEKYLKAVLTAAGQSFPLTHDLTTLHDLGAAVGLNLPIPQLDLVRITRFGVGIRYPGFLDPPSLAEARQAIRTAGRVRRLCRRHLGLA